MTAPQADWNYPTRMHIGAGRVQELALICASLGMRAPLLVTDPGLVGAGIAHRALDILAAADLPCAVFGDVRGNPIGANVETGVQAFRAGGHDGVIALGGGSALDVGKAVAFLSGQTRPLWDFEDTGDNWTRALEDRIAPVVAIPTTAGTGSEVGRASVITDTERQVKKIIFHPKMLPRAVILDAELTVGLPAHITAATGMDALSHSLEAYCAPGYHPMADGIAVEGIRLVAQWLPGAVRDGGDIDARTHMLVASSMGATAFQKGLGGMHALAHTLGALFDAHHGLLNAILMPYVLVANRTAVSARIEHLSRSMGLRRSDFHGFLDWVLELRQTLGITHTLADIGISGADADRVGRLAAVDPSAAGNPLPLSAADYAQIFTRSVQGTL